MARIVVCGYMIRHPVAGNLLAYFHYLLGLDWLGHEVLYLEESGWSQSCYDPINRNYSDDPQVGLYMMQALMNTYGVNATMGYVNRETGTVYGTDWAEIKRMLSTADLLMNIGGVCWLPDFLLCKRRLLLDMYPFFTQVGTFAAEGRNDYHVYFSYGTNIGQPNCTIPTGGIDWLPMVPPVVPEIWQDVVSIQDEPESLDNSNTVFTTVTNWNAYGGITYQGEYYGQKREEFIDLLELPSHCSSKLELALSGRTPEIAEIKKHLQAAGWSVRDGGEIGASLSTYQTYLAGSRGEFSVAKQVYVKTRSGWFSDRSVCYLAAGRPVITQETSFSKFLPTGKGLFAFNTMEDILTAVDAIKSDYEGNCRAAREIASEYFAAEKVIGSLMERAGL